MTTISHFQQEAVMNEDGSMEDYVDKYCKMILSKFREQSRLEQLELQLTANGFSSLTEVNCGVNDIPW